MGKALKGLGYRRDPPHKRTQKDARQFLGAHLGAVTPDRDLSAFEAPIFNQLSYEGCLGHGTAQLIVIALASMGVALPLVPSPRDIYTLTRCLGRLSPSVPLIDDGGMPSDTMAGISFFGIRPMGALNPAGRTDCTDANINAEPTLGELLQDAHQLIVGEYRIDEAASDVCDQVAACISLKGVPVGVGCFVDTGFMQLSASSAPYGAPNQADPNGGGHWMAIVGVRTLADGSRLFKLVNSWGEVWGDGGHTWVTEAFVRAAYDLYAFTVREVKS